jgi:hypothetical protein
VATEVLERLKSPLVTTELALFNLEINLPPALLENGCLSAMAATLDDLLARVGEAARPSGADVVLAGILPTLRASDLVPSNLTPLPRYRELDRAVTALGHGAFQIHIRAVDDLRLTRESLIVEAGNCSFQVHLQVAPDEFPRLYNAAQAFAAPVLAAATNSPLLLGKRLWHEVENLPVRCRYRTDVALQAPVGEVKNARVLAGARVVEGLRGTGRTEAFANGIDPRP